LKNHIDVRIKITAIRRPTNCREFLLRSVLSKKRAYVTQEAFLSHANLQCT